MSAKRGQGTGAHPHWHFWDVVSTVSTRGAKSCCFPGLGLLENWCAFMSIYLQINGL